MQRTKSRTAFNIWKTPFGAGTVKKSKQNHADTTRQDNSDKQPPRLPDAKKETVSKQNVKRITSQHTRKNHPACHSDNNDEQRHSAQYGQQTRLRQVAFHDKRTRKQIKKPIKPADYRTAIRILHNFNTQTVQYST